MMAMNETNNLYEIQITVWLWAVQIYVHGIRKTNVGCNDLMKEIREAQIRIVDSWF